jgi:hypothetical protein
LCRSKPWVTFRCWLDYSNQTMLFFVGEDIILDCVVFHMPLTISTFREYLFIQTCIFITIVVFSEKGMKTSASAITVVVVLVCFCIVIF